jgi:glycosyltransferase involved in cell wall biosynthesis
VIASRSLPVDVADAELRTEIAVGEELFAAGMKVEALAVLEGVRWRAGTGSRVWAEAMLDIAVMFHDAGHLGDAYVHARHAVRVAPDLEGARETLESCADALGLRAVEQRGERILIVVSRFYPSVGGTELLAEDLAVELIRLGYPVDVLCTADGCRRAEWRGISIHETTEALVHRDLARLLASGRFAGVIGISSPMAFPVSGLLAYPHPIPGVRSLVVPCVNAEGDAQIRRTGIVDDSRMLLRADAVGYSSHGGWDRRLLDDFGVPGVYLPNAVPRIEPRVGVRSSLGIPAETKVILHVANFWPEKNHLAFLAELRRTSGDWRLISIGGPSLEHPELAEQVAAAAARDPRVTLLGALPREEVAGAMVEADVLVLPSTAEATPLVLLEAMSNGLPWIASDTCGSAPDLAGGLIVPQGAFAAAIERLLADRGACAALAAAGRAAYEGEYSWESVAPRYLAALDLPVPARLAAAS